MVWPRWDKDWQAFIDVALRFLILKTFDISLFIVALLMHYGS